MARDEFVFFAVALPDLTGDEAMRSAMEAEALDTVFLVPFIRNGVHFPFQRDRRVKGGFEHAHQQPSRQDFPELADRLDIGRIVGRGHAVVGLHGGDHFVRQFVDAVIALGNDRLEADRVDLFHGLERAGPRVRQILQEQVDPLGVGGHAESGQFLFGPVPVVAVGKNRAVAAADPFNFGFDQDVGIRHVEQFVLQRSAADVTDEN